VSTRPSLAEFLATELAPWPGRARATARIVVACVVATAITAGFHVPEGHWATITIFTVSQADAGASLTKGIQRAVGTVLGGVAGILSVVLFADEPWIRVPLLGLFAASGLFLSRTTTAPYVGLLAGITALLIGAQVHGSDPSAAVALGLWRIVLIVLGVAIGTGAQLYLWPDDPEDHLLVELAERLRIASETIGRCIAGTPAVATDSLEADLVHHLDLLANAEARYPSLRLRHLEQITLIGGVEHLLTAAAGLELASGAGRVPSESTRSRLARIAARCVQLRDALAARRPCQDDGAAASDDAAVAAAGDVHMLPAMVEMERVLARIAEATGFLGRPRGGSQSGAVTARTPLDVPGAMLLTPACSLSNTADLTFALKGGLAASFCDLLVSALAWPGIQTSIWTTVLVAQANQGAIVQKALLRLVGAAIGGLFGVLVIVSVLPNLENLISFLVVVAIGSAGAAWLSTGSTRIAYAGVQIGLAFALTLGDAPGPTTSIVVARDRVLGVLLGNTVAALVYLGFGSGRARDAMVRSMAATLRALSTLLRVGTSGLERPSGLGPIRGRRWAVYQNLLTTLRLHDEASYEPGARLPETLAARDAVRRLVGDVQGLFLAILALVRHRLDIDLLEIPAAVRVRLHSLNTAVAESIEAAAARVEGRPAAFPDSRALVGEAEQALASPSLAPLDAPRRAHLAARLELYRHLFPLLERLDIDSRAGALGDRRAGNAVK
jgi:multidrug resistance protein MdtO